MTTENSELKTSDEILEELFGMCQKRQLQSSDESSQSTDCENEDNVSKKRKKKKKKRKKSKKHRHSSVESAAEEDKSYKRKKKKNKNHGSDEEKKVKFKHKIKQEPEDVPFEEIKTAIKSENENLMDTATGKTLTIDDVFNSFSILPADSEIEVKPFDLANVKIKKENGCDNIEDDKPVLKPDGDQKSVPTNDMNEKDRTLALNEVFEGPAEAEGEKDKSKPGKISIKNLKNSCVYEATIKEVEEQERLKAEKYEEGEISSSSSSSNEDVSDSPCEGETLTVKEKHHRKHKHRSKNHEHSKHHSRTHRKHSHEKNFHKSSRHTGSSSPYRSAKRSYSDHHYHETNRRSYHSRYSRGDSEESHGSAQSESRKSRSKREKSERSRSRTRSRVHSKERKSRSKSTEKIDKQKLLEIARKNAISLLKQGALPASVIVNKDKIASIKAGGKTVDELTDFCKQLSKKDAEGQESISSGSDLESNEDRDKAFHHPFQLKERPSSIVMNIRNAVSLPTKTAQEKTLQLSKQLSLQYPVSSGHQHRTNESEWVPVEKPTVPAPLVVPVTAAPVTAMVPLEPYYTMNTPTPVNPPLPNYPPIDYNSGYSNSIIQPPNPNVDIGSIVAQRLEAIRRLSENPQDPIGNNLIQVADSKMKVWAESKVQPGLFTGSTGVKPLTTAELSSGFKAWAKKNQFVAAKPVSSDKGEALMKKMGWQPGEGLGKYKQGPPEPCEISMKTDRKGLAEQTISFQQNNVGKKLFELNQNKHPVSLLNEYCSRKKIGVPQYDCEEKEGVGKRKLFLFSVSVQGNKFTPKSPCCNKKHSKIEAATLCLQALGILPAVTNT